MRNYATRQAINGRLNMSWLNSYKKKFDDEKAEKERKMKESQDAWNHRHQQASNDLNDFVKYHLQDLVGKKTKDGKILRLEIKENYARLYADNEEFVCLHYYYREEEDTDGDGMSWGNGKYYLVKDMQLCRPHKSRGGYDWDGKRSRLFNEEELAHYLLIFLE